MTLRDQIEEKYKKALTEHNEVEVSIFRLIKSAAKNTEIEKKHDLSDEELLVILEKEAKQRRDSIEQFRAGGRDDLAEKEDTELKIIESFLPEKMGDDAIKEIVKKIIAENKGVDLGRAMGLAMSQLKGKADGSLVQKIVREELGV